MRCLVLLSAVFIAACGTRSLPATEGGDGGLSPDTIPGPDLRSPGPSGPCRGNQDCHPADYCHLEAGCPGAASTGACLPRPTTCPTIDGRICGCDGKGYDSPCEAHAAGVSVRHQGPCTQGDPACNQVNCLLYNDCCSCEATTKLYTPAPCPAMCKQPRCDALGIRQPIPYCLSGHCLLANTHDMCQVDDDCYTVDDCCFCLALPKTVPAPPCPADCFVGQCTALGLTAAKPACVAGTCKLVLP